MSAQENSVKLGKENQNLVLETAGRIWVKVQDRFYELDFRNQGKGGTTHVTNVVHNEVSEETEGPDMSKYVTKNFLKSTLSEYVTKRNWRDVVQTTNMLQNSLLEGFTEGISPITVNTMQVVVGSEQLQYDFIEGLKNVNGQLVWDDTVKSGGFISENGEEILTTYSVKLKGGWIKHHTLDGPDTVRALDDPETVNNNREELMSQYCRWHIEDTEFGLSESAGYYVYIKVPKLNCENGYPKKDREHNNNLYYFSSSEETSSGSSIAATHTIGQALYLKTNARSISDLNNNANAQYALSNIAAQYVISETAIEMTTDDITSEDYPYYYLLFAIINSPSDDGSRSYTTMNGFTEITPGRVTAYRFMSPDGIQYLNFIDKSMHLGDANSYIHFDAKEAKFYIKGTIVQSPAGDEFPIPCYRGEFTKEQIKDLYDPPIFYYGDSITFEGSTWINTYKDEPISGVTPNETITITVDTQEQQIYPWSLYAAKGDPLFVLLDKEIDSVQVDNEGKYTESSSTTITVNLWLFRGDKKQEITRLTVSPNSAASGRITATTTYSSEVDEENTINTHGTVTITISPASSGQDDTVVPKQTEFTIRVSTGTINTDEEKVRAAKFILVGTRAGDTGRSTFSVMLYKRFQYGETVTNITFPCIYSVKTGLERVQDGSTEGNVTKYASDNTMRYNFGGWTRTVPTGNGTCYVASAAVDTNKEQFIADTDWVISSITPKNIAGKIMRGITKWEAGVSYWGIQDIVLDANGNDTQPFYDVVYYPDGPSRGFYYCIQGHTSNSSHAHTNPYSLDSSLWSPASQFDFIATNVLLANNAHIDILSSTGIYVYDDSVPPKVIAGIQGLDGTNDPVNIFAGANDVAGIPTANFRVYGKTGRVKIKGSVEADGDNFEGASNIWYAIKSNNGLLVNGGNTNINASSDIDLTSGGNIYIKAQDSYGAQGNYSYINIADSAMYLTSHANNGDSVQLGLSGDEATLLRYANSHGVTENIVSSGSVKHIVILPANSSSSSMSDDDTIYFIESA